MAINELTNAININREAIDAYFALGSLYRSNGEFDKAISIHRSIIARKNTSESTRSSALKELAIDFDKGGFVDKAIETYKDILKVNHDQHDVIQALCRIYENVQDWDQAYHYRVMMGKIGYESQTETISHILVQKAKVLFQQGKFTKCQEDLEDALRFAPTLSAKILQLRLSLINNETLNVQQLFFEVIKEHPEYAAFVFKSLEESFESNESIHEEYLEGFKKLEEFFLQLDDHDLATSPAIVLAKINIWKKNRQVDKIHKAMNHFIKNTPTSISET